MKIENNEQSTSAPPTIKPRKKRYPVKTRYDPNANTIFGKPVVIELRDVVEEQRSDVYMGMLVERLIQIAQERMKYDRFRYKPEFRFSWANLARATGIRYRNIVSYFIQRNRPMDIQTLDKILWAMKLSVLDLLKPRELVTCFTSMSYDDMVPLHKALKRTIDKAKQSVHTEPSAPVSQATPTEDEDEDI